RGGGEGSASVRARCKSARAGNGRISQYLDRSDPTGWMSWHVCGGKPSWSASIATTSSTTAGPSQRARRKLPESRMLGNGPVRFGGGPRGKGPAQQAPRRVVYPVPV